MYEDLYLAGARVEPGLKFDRLRNHGQKDLSYDYEVNISINTTGYKTIKNVSFWFD